MRDLRNLGPAASYILGLLAALGLFALAGCASWGASGPESPSAVITSANQQDAVFAKQLIELNEQLVTIADVLIGKTDNSEVAAGLTELVRTGNERIVLAKGWLQTWGRTAVNAPPAPGILTDAQADALIDNNGPALLKAAKAAVESQLNGTLQISEAEVAGGQYGAATALATQLKAKSSAELSRIDQFQQ